MSPRGDPPPARRAGAAAPARWAEVRALAEAALALPASARARFLETRCRADPALQAEVEAQVDACERAARSDFLAEPAAARAAPLFAAGAEDEPLEPERPRAETATEPGAAVEAALHAALAGRYAVERRLVRGGTATVYLARDTRHGRRVALKVLEPALGAPMSAERFLREIRVTAGLTHPHILPLHDSGDAAGLPYYVMPYIEGETLRDRLAREGRLPIADVLRLVREVASALAYAHRRGIVHRDIKPANILLADGHAVVADFGIARALHRAREAAEPAAEEPVRPAPGFSTDTLTAAGTSPGTPAYMAPEQASGGDIDERADLYALGVVAYEALAGAHPFAARTPPGLIAAPVERTPPPLAGHRPDVPPALAALVMRLLANNAADRPPSAEALLHALEGVSARPTRKAAAGLRASIVAAGLVLVAGSAGYAVWRRAPGAAVPTAQDPIHALAVLPFINPSGDPRADSFSTGLTDELTHALVDLPGLRVAGRSASDAFKGKAVAARAVGRVLAVDAFVHGSVQRTGDRFRVTARLVRTADGAVRWDSVFETRSRDALAAQDALTRAITAALARTLADHPAAADDRAADIERGTADQEAYELFLKGRYNFLLRNQTRLLRAVAYFKQAIARDPSFARAYAGLAMAYTVLPTYFPSSVDTVSALAAASAERALALDSTLGDAHFALASVLEAQLRFHDAIDHYRMGLTRDPTSMTGHFWLGISLLNIGRTADALVQLRLATQLDPLAHSAAAAVAMALLDERRFPEAVNAARHSLAIDSTFWGAVWPLGIAQVFEGQPDSAIRSLEWGLRLHPQHPQLSTALILAYAAAGRWTDAARLRAQLHRPGGDLSGGVAAARADMIFGDREPALRLLASDAGRRHWYASGAFFGCNPLMDPLRSDARYRRAMRAVGVEGCPPARPLPIPARPGQALP